jgi:hypothetical protein
MSRSLPTRDEMIRNALVSLEQARGALSDARDWLASDWRPIGSELTTAQADARTTTRQVVGRCKDEIDTATDALRQALAGGAR